MLRFRPVLAVASLAFASCSGSVTFRSPVDWLLDVGEYYGGSYSKIAGLLTQDQVIDRISCSGPGDVGDQECQDKVPMSGAGSDLVMLCNDQNLCDPEPYRFVEDLGVHDLRKLAEPNISVVDRVRLLEVELTLHTNTTNVDLPSFEVRWGPVSSTTGTVATTTYALGSVPAIAAGQTGMVEDIVLDQAQFDRLDEYIKGTSTEVRFFLATTYDAEPDVGIPLGRLDVTLGLIIKASGSLR